MRHVFTIIIYLDCFIDCVTGHELVEWSHTASIFFCCHNFVAMPTVLYACEIFFKNIQITAGKIRANNEIEIE